jgi:hypothetical protein
MGGDCSTRGRVKKAYKILATRSEEDHSEDLGVDGRVVLEFIFAKWVGKMWTDFIWLRTALLNMVMNIRIHKRWGVS